MFDIIFVLPYKFSDHPLFPEAILKRALEEKGFSVGVIETPYHLKASSFTILGKPRLFFAIISGPVDSLVLNYTSLRKRRREDLYQTDGKAFFPDSPKSIKYKIRPDRTVIVFSSKIKEVFKGVPIVIGGIEASLRRFAHYDFLDDRVRRSILLDSRADILVWGLGEKQIVRIAELMRRGAELKDIKINGISKVEKEPSFKDYVKLPSYEELLEERELLLKATLIVEKESFKGSVIVQKHQDRFVVQYGAEFYTPHELEKSYSYNYTRLHLDGSKKLTPALKFNLFSVQTHRGCGGGCSYCSINFHEGKRIISRSIESIVKEIYSLKKHPLWKGVVYDLSAPSPEMYGSECNVFSCKRNSCIYKKVCGVFKKEMNFHGLLKEVRKIDGVKVYVESGVRYDLLLDKPDLLYELLKYHTRKFLRVAPEHSQENVLRLMRKPDFSKFEEFYRMFLDVKKKIRKNIDLIPYIIVGFPGESIKDVYELKKRLGALGIKRVDLQVFTPTPGSVATAMYYSGVDFNFRKIPVEKSVKKLAERKETIVSNL